MPCYACGGPGGHSRFECADYGYIPEREQGDKVDEITALREENARLTGEVERVKLLRAEVARLEGLILDWEAAAFVGSGVDYRTAAEALNDEAKRIRARCESRVICDTHHTGGGAYYRDECPQCIRAQREEGR